MKMKLELAFLTFLSLVLVNVAANTYTDSEARRILSNAGITVNHPKPQTSLEGIRQNTISKLLTLKSASHCTIVVTGGTEPGHSTSGTKNHGTGYKVDIRLDTCINNYITTTFTYTGLRSDGAKLYKSAAGSVYALEGNHWDILYP